MNVIRRLLRASFFVCATFFALPPPAPAQADPEADTAEVNRYRLSEPALAKYTAATHALAEVLAENPPPCDDAEDTSLNAMAARMDTLPGVKAALAGAGISSREYIVFGLAAFGAGMGSWALTEGQGELPPGVSPENVEFYQAHETELEELSGVLPENDCGDGEHEGGEEDDAYSSDEWEADDEDEYDG